MALCAFWTALGQPERSFGSGSSSDSDSDEVSLVQYSSPDQPDGPKKVSGRTIRSPLRLSIW